ncbi:MAG: hypothetical protein WC789_01010 [Lentisphaeria bacterium]|jgi:hypothetical protein
MSRKSSRRAGALALLLFLCGFAAGGGAGCGRKAHAPAELALDSAAGRAVAGQLAELERVGAAEFVRRHGVPGSPHAAGLEWALGQAAAAESCELRGLERFGGGVFRAVVRIRTGGEEREAAFLLVRGEGGRLCWAGPN